jgi:hypothetical protein
MPAGRRTPNGILAGMIGLLLLLTWLGARELAANGVWYDEWWSLYIAGAPMFGDPLTVPEVWQRVTAEDPWQGVFYPSALAVWGRLVGWSDYAARALSLLAGVLAVAVIFRLGGAVARSARIGLGAAALAGTSIWLIHFLHELRGYTILVLGTALLLLAYYRLMHLRRAFWGNYALMILAIGLLLNTHYYAALTVAALGLWHLGGLLRARPDRRWWGVLVAFALGGLLFLPWLGNLLRAIELTRSQSRAPADASLLWMTARDMVAAFSNGSPALLALLIAFSLIPARVRRVGFAWGLLALLLPLNLIAYSVLRVQELRYSLPLLPLLALTAAAGLAELARRRVPMILILLIWASGIVTTAGDFRMARTIQRYPDQPIREMAAVLRGRVQPDDVIVNLVDTENIPELARTPLEHYMADFGARLEVVEDRTYPGVQNFAARVREAVGGAPRLWLTGDPRWQIEQWPLFEYLLNEQQMYRCATLAETDTMRIEAYGRVTALDNLQIYPGARAGAIGAPYLAEKRLHVWLGFEIAPDFPRELYSVALHVIDAGGLRAQADSALPERGLDCRYTALDLTPVPPGAYELRLVIYNWQTGERLPTTSGDSYPLLAPVVVP